MPTKITVDESAINAFVNNPRGPVADILQAATEVVAAPAVVVALSKPAARNVQHFRPSQAQSPTRGGRVVGYGWEHNPPPAVPLKRSGNLQRSVEVTTPERSAEGKLHCDVVVSTIAMYPPNRQFFDYATLLVNRGYLFVQPNDPRFEIVPRSP